MLGGSVPLRCTVPQFLLNRVRFRNLLEAEPVRDGLK